MKTNTQLLGAVSALALVVMTSTPAMAEGIRAGTDIRNTVTVTYDVNGITQAPETAEDIFAVDRRVNVDVTTVGVQPVEVSPGQTGAVLTFDVTNLSNDTVDLDLTAVLASGAAGNLGSNGAADNGDFIIFVDGDGDGQYDVGEEVDFLSNVAADETRQVLVFANINLAAADGESFEVDLNANAFVAGTLGTGGATELVESAGDSADQSVVDTVLADGNSTFSLDSANDGSDTDRASFEVSGAEVSVIKSSSVIWDPVNLTNNPKAIPGAVIEYCIAVRNAPGGATASNISVSDTLPADVVYLASSDANSLGIRLNTDVSISGTNATCSNGTAPAGGPDAGFTAAAGGNPATVVGTLADIAENSSAGLSFRVVIPAATAPTP